MQKDLANGTTPPVYRYPMRWPINLHSFSRRAWSTGDTVKLHTKREVETDIQFSEHNKEVRQLFQWFPFWFSAHHGLVSHLLQIQTSKHLCSVINQADHKEKYSKQSLRRLGMLHWCCQQLCQTTGRWEMRETVKNQILFPHMAAHIVVSRWSGQS